MLTCRPWTACVLAVCSCTSTRSSHATPDRHHWSSGSPSGSRPATRETSDWPWDRGKSRQVTFLILCIPSSQHCVKMPMHNLILMQLICEESFCSNLIIVLLQIQNNLIKVWPNNTLLNSVWTKTVFFSYLLTVTSESETEPQAELRDMKKKLTRQNIKKQNFLPFQNDDKVQIKLFLSTVTKAKAGDNSIY